MFSIRDITEHKRAEEKLQRQEELFRSLIENSADAISIINADGTNRYMSPSYGAVLTYVPGEEVGSSVFNQVHLVVGVVSTPTLGRVSIGDSPWRGRPRVRDISLSFREWPTVVAVEWYFRSNSPCWLPPAPRSMKMVYFRENDILSGYYADTTLVLSCRDKG